MYLDVNVLIADSITLASGFYYTPDCHNLHSLRKRFIFTIQASPLVTSTSRLQEGQHRLAGQSINLTSA